MADKPKNELPKVPPFIIPGASNPRTEEPPSQPAHVVQASKPIAENNNGLSQQGMFSFLMLLISVISLGVAMISGAWFAYSVLTSDSGDILSKVIVVGLAYAVGWIFSAIGVRSLGNLILPYAIQVYTWVVLGGILLLQVFIMLRLYQQAYHFSNYIKYLSLFGAGLIALVGLHLLLEKHSLIPFGVVILLASLGHLYSIVYHYIFVTNVVYKLVWGDIIFFFVTTIVSVLMLAHFGLLNGMRRWVDRTFNPKDNQFVPPN